MYAFFEGDGRSLGRSYGTNVDLLAALFRREQVTGGEPREISKQRSQGSFRSHQGRSTQDVAVELEQGGVQVPPFAKGDALAHGQVSSKSFRMSRAGASRHCDAVPQSGEEQAAVIQVHEVPTVAKRSSTTKFWRGWKPGCTHRCALETSKRGIMGAVTSNIALVRDMGVMMRTSTLRPARVTVGGVGGHVDDQIGGGDIDVFPGLGDHVQIDRLAPPSPGPGACPYRAGHSRSRGRTGESSGRKWRNSSSQPQQWSHMVRNMTVMDHTASPPAEWRCPSSGRSAPVVDVTCPPD